MHLPEGALLQNGKYKIIRFIKSGGFGCTYEGELIAIGVKVAIKEFFPTDFCNRESDYSVSVGTKSKKGDFLRFKRSFMKEASILFKMQNPNIVRVTDVFEENGTAYYVMDYIDGLSLADLVTQKGKLSESEALGYIRQICEALKYVHSHNRMHMDVKPGNIMVDKSGKAILIDFGASKYFDEETGEQTSSNQGTYTKGYAPFEQVSRSLKSFNPPTDIYALGATLYKLLTGITPPNSLHLMSGSETLSPLSSDISLPTRKAIEEAMKKDSKDRPQSIDEFEQILLGKVQKDDEKTDLKISESNQSGFKSNLNIHEQNLKGNTRTRNVIIGCASVLILGLVCFFIFGGESDKGLEVQTEPTELIGEIEAKVPQSDPQVTSPAKPKGIEEASSLLTEEEYTNEVIKDPNAEENEALDGVIKDHVWVDLGLPSGLKWATCNIGASRPEEYGDYFAWGETNVKTTYTKENSETYGKDVQWLRENGYINENYNLTPSHDAAVQNWKGSWRMPKLDEIRELIRYTNYSSTTRNQVHGYLFKSRVNNKSIFLPAAGWCENSYFKEEGSYGRYWSSTVYSSNDTYAYDLYFYSSSPSSTIDNRYLGYLIRPVTK